MVIFLGVFFGWLGVKVKWISDRHESLERVKSDWGRLGTIRSATRQIERQAPWSLRVLGEPGVTFIVVKTDSAEQLNLLRALFPEASFGEIGSDGKFLWLD